MIAKLARNVQTVTFLYLKMENARVQEDKMHFIIVQLKNANVTPLLY